MSNFQDKLTSKQSICAVRGCDKIIMDKLKHYITYHQNQMHPFYSHNQHLRYYWKITNEAEWIEVLGYKLFPCVWREVQLKVNFEKVQFIINGPDCRKIFMVPKNQNFSNDFKSFKTLHKHCFTINKIMIKNNEKICNKHQSSQQFTSTNNNNNDDTSSDDAPNTNTSIRLGRSRRKQINAD